MDHLVRNNLVQMSRQVYRILIAMEYQTPVTTVLLLPMIINRILIMMAKVMYVMIRPIL
jgi:hypothetical protein